MKSVKKYQKIFYLSIILFLSYCTFYYHSYSWEFVITRNIISGETKPEVRSGHHFTLPWVLASKIDTRPHKVCIASASRNMNCRLVQFDTSQWKNLLEYEGFYYYWWYNRISFSLSQDNYRGVDNLLLGHAYGKTRGSFVKILEDFGDE